MPEAIARATSAHAMASRPRARPRFVTISTNSALRMPMMISLARVTAKWKVWPASLMKSLATTAAVTPASTAP